jgi:hypothetical protein
MCALFALALVTVRLKTREAMMRYKIAELEMVEQLLLERLATETDPGLRMAYASALGKLRAQASVDRLLALLCAAQEEASRMELALALARIVGDEHHFIQLWRQMGEDPGTSASQVVTAIGRQVRQQPVEAKELTAALEACAGALAREELESGAALLSRAIGLLPLETVDETSGKILDECAARLEEWGFRRSEYLLLALHTLYVSVPA